MEIENQYISYSKKSAFPSKKINQVFLLSLSAVLLQFLPLKSHWAQWIYLIFLPISTVPRNGFPFFTVKFKPNFFAMSNKSCKSLGFPLFKIKVSIFLISQSYLFRVNIKKILRILIIKFNSIELTLNNQINQIVKNSNYLLLDTLYFLQFIVLLHPQIFICKTYAILRLSHTLTTEKPLWLTKFYTAPTFFVKIKKPAS